MLTDKDYAELFCVTTGWETKGDDTQYKILELDNEVIFLFAESNSKEDWRNNFNFPSTAYRSAAIPFRAHRGFLRCWKLINDFFLETAAQIAKPITVVGWSYGGAIATLCMEDLWFTFEDKRESLRLVTFGAPRVIGVQNYDRIKERWKVTTRYTNGTDIVTMLPFPFMGFRHVCDETHIGGSKTLWGMLHPAANHDISCYIASLGGSSDGV
jgi:predicted lipase